MGGRQALSVGRHPHLARARRTQPSLAHPREVEHGLHVAQDAGQRRRARTDDGDGPCRRDDPALKGHGPWLDLGFDQVKAEMLKREESIRSRKVAGIEQELWGILLA